MIYGELLAVLGVETSQCEVKAEEVIVPFNVCCHLG